MSEQGGLPRALARAAAGALFFDEDGRVMIVYPSYKTNWEIPGGGVEPGETPYEACVREVGEELGIQPPIGRLLAVDWAPHQGIGDLILFVFDGGVLGADTRGRITFADGELTGFGFHPVEDVDDLLNERLARRVKAAAAARELGGPAYLEYGRSVPG